MIMSLSSLKQGCIDMHATSISYEHQFLSAPPININTYMSRFALKLPQWNLKPSRKIASSAATIDVASSCPISTSKNASSSTSIFTSEPERASLSMSTSGAVAVVAVEASQKSDKRKMIEAEVLEESAKVSKITDERDHISTPPHASISAEAEIDSPSRDRGPSMTILISENLISRQAALISAMKVFC